MPFLFVTYRCTVMGRHGYAAARPSAPGASWDGHGTVATRSAASLPVRDAGLDKAYQRKDIGMTDAHMPSNDSIHR